MELEVTSVAPRYAAILESCEPFVVSYTANWPHLDLAPLGLTIPQERVYTATSLRSRAVIDGLHRLDSLTFGDQDMLMPRWVLFDCGEFPGLVFGFGRVARKLAPAVREHYGVATEADDETFVPLSMWVAIRCAEPRAWFGHNLSSANLLLGDAALPGLGTLTKLLGIFVARARVQYGATQWASTSLNLHLTLGLPLLTSAWTPAHTHPQTFSYRSDVDSERLVSALRGDFRREPRPAADAAGVVTVAADDEATMRVLQDEIESGAQLRLVAVESGTPNRLYLRRE